MQDMSGNNQQELQHPSNTLNNTETSAYSGRAPRDSIRESIAESSFFPYTAFIEEDQRRLQLTPHEIAKLRELLNKSCDASSLAAASADSDYPGFGESTHAWAIFADNPKKRAGLPERLVGILIIVFQLFTYWMFAAEAIGDYQSGQVAITTKHGDCIAAGEEPQDNLVCEAGYTNDFDAFVAFFMLGIFLASDFIQAFKVIQMAESKSALAFACLAAVEVASAYLSASISVSYNLYIGEVTDAVEVGVGLLFIRELSQRAYVGIRDGKGKQYRVFFGVLVALVLLGMMMDPLCELMFASKGTSY